MVGFSSWLESNWSNVVGAMGIIGSLLFTGAYFRADARNRLITNLLALDERHRALLREVQQTPELKRILSNEVDLIAYPLTPEEGVCLRQVIQQFETGWRLEKILNRGELKLLALDAGRFFSRPLPRAVWEEVKRYRNPKFVHFVQRAIEQSGRLSRAGD